MLGGFCSVFPAPQTVHLPGHVWATDCESESPPGEEQGAAGCAQRIAKSPPEGAGRDISSSLVSQQKEPDASAADSEEESELAEGPSGT